MGNTVTTAFEFKESGRGLSEIIKDLDTTDNKAKAVAAAISKMADETRTELARAESATEAFSKALGPEMVAKLEQGGSGVDGMIDKLRRLGLTYEDIEQNADELAASMRKFDELDLAEPRAQVSGTSDDVDKLSHSARGANSALANMIGNSAQDVGQLGGIAGSAGVAIGQMAEYASDAALDGEKLGASLASMAAVAGPIVALTVGVQLLGMVLHKNNEEQKAVAESTKEIVSALAQAKQAGDDAAAALDDVASGKAQDLFEGLGNKTDKTVSALKTMGVSYDDIVQAFRDGDGPLADVLNRFADLDERLQRDVDPDLVTHNRLVEEQARRWGVSTQEAQRQIDAMRILSGTIGGQVDIQRRANIESQAAAAYMGIASTTADRYHDSLRGVNDAQGASADTTAKARAQSEMYEQQLHRAGDAALAEAAAEDAARDALDRKRASVEATAAAEDRRLNASLRALGGDIGARAATQTAVGAFNDPNLSFDQKVQAALSAAVQIAGIRQTELESRGNKVDARVQAQLVKEELDRFATMFGQIVVGDSATQELGDAVAEVLRSYIGQVSGSGARTPFVGAYDGGGTVPGAPGAPGVAIVHGGETVRTPEQEAALGRGAAPVSVHVELTVNAGVGTDGLQVGRQIVEVLERLFRYGGTFGPATVQAIQAAAA